MWAIEIIDPSADHDENPVGTICPSSTLEEAEEFMDRMQYRLKEEGLVGTIIEIFDGLDSLIESWQEEE